MINDKLGTTEDMLVWAKGVMFSRTPDFIIGQNYLRRWWIVPRNPAGGCYLHRIERSDDDRALHDHPWDNTSFFLEGTVTEETPTGRVVRSAGEIVQRKATDRHRLEIEPGTYAVSLFFFGPWQRDWGFWCDEGNRFVPWWEFTDPGDKGAVGRGCGE